MTRRRAGMTLLEVAVVSVLLSLLLYVVGGALALAKSHFLAGELSHALQSAVVMSARLEDDLRAAVRDPERDAAIEAGTSPTGQPAFAFYRFAVGPDGAPLIVPVRWALEEPAGGTTAHLVRTEWNLAARQFVTDRYAWAPLPRATGFQLIGDAGDTEVQQVLLTTLARARRLERTPGAAQDRVTLPVAVCVPRWPDEARALFRPEKRLDELP